MAKKKAASSPTPKSKPSTIVNKQTPPKQVQTKQKELERSIPEDAFPVKSTLNEVKPEPGVLLNVPDVESLGLPSLRRPFLVEYFPTPAQIKAERKVRENELDIQYLHTCRVLSSIRYEWEGKMKESGQKAAINVAYRTKLGEIVSPLQYVIQVDVSDKLPDKTLTSRKWFSIPQIVNNVPVKVRQINVTSTLGDIRSMAATGLASSDTDEGGSIRGGSAITSSGKPGTWGTLGICFRLLGGEMAGVTNHHVGGDRGSRVCLAHSPFTNVGDIANSSTTEDAFCDAASIISNFVEGISGLTFEGRSYRFMDNLYIPANGRISSQDDVFKVGAAMPERVDGVIRDTRRQVFVNNLNPPGWFQDVIECSSDVAFIQDGDSGSVLVTMFTQGGETFPLVIGLNFAGSDDGRASYAIPFGQVIQQLSISIDKERLVTV